MQENKRFPGQGIQSGRTKLPPRPYNPPPPRKAPSSRRWSWLGIAVIFMACALATVLLAGVLGYVDGRRDRQETLRAQALEHYRLGVQYMDNAEYELAEAEFEESLRMEPELGQAWDQLREARARQGTVPTPTAIVFPPTETPPAAAPTAPATPIAEATSEDVKAGLLAEAGALYEDGAYAEAITKIEQLLRLDANYGHEQVVDILFHSYARLGAALVDEDRFEEAVRYFDLALKLRPDDQGVQVERKLAAGYSTATSYWDADWERAIAAFGELYALQPAYKDVASRFYNAQIEYADLLGERGQWCQAAGWYEKALQLRAAPAVVAKQQTMAANCANDLPTPTPAGDGTGTPAPNAEGTPAPASTPEVSTEALRALGLSGTLYYAVNDPIRRAYVLYQINADGSANKEVVQGMHQVSINRAGTALVARARSNVATLGLYRIDLTGAIPPPLTQVTSHVDDLYASFSPDGGEVLFTSNRMSQRLWTLFIGPSAGAGDLRTVLEGQTPAWSPAGDRIAYKGCDEQANNCGIWTATSAGADKQGVVMDPSAGFPAWSPDGKRIAFMSNRAGNWEVYLVNPDGSGLRRLTQGAGSEGMPTWSPDGGAIAYLSDRDGQWGIYLQRLNDGRVAKLVSLNTAYDDWMMEKIAWGPRR